MMKKKGQEEMVGFVLIVLVVSIIFLVFLGISLRGGVKSSSDSREVYQFLESSMEFTTECGLSSTTFYTLGELIRECYDGSGCFEGEDSCEVLNHTLSGMLWRSWNVDSESAIKGYEFTSAYVLDGNKIDIIINLKEGECNGTIKGATYLAPAFPGKIRNELIVCG